MLSVQTPSMAGMDRLVGVGGGGATAPLVVVVTGGGGTAKDKARGGGLDEKHQQELSLIMGRGGSGPTHRHGGRIGLADTMNYPPSIRLADGEPLDSIHSLLHLRAPYQHSELTRSSVQPPPNKSVCDVPAHHRCTTSTSSSSINSNSSNQQPHKNHSNKRPHQHMSAPMLLYQTRDPQKSSSSTALLQSSSSSMNNDDTSSNSSSTSSLGSSCNVPRSHSVSSRSKTRNETSESGQKKDTIWSAFRQNVFGRFGNGQKSCEQSSGDLERQRRKESHHRRKQQMAVMVPVPVKQNSASASKSGQCQLKCSQQCLGQLQQQQSVACGLKGCCNQHMCLVQQQQNCVSKCLQPDAACGQHKAPGCNQHCLAQYQQLLQCGGCCNHQCVNQQLNVAAKPSCSLAQLNQQQLVQQNIVCVQLKGCCCLSQQNVAAKGACSQLVQQSVAQQSKGSSNAAQQNQENHLNHVQNPGFQAGFCQSTSSQKDNSCCQQSSSGQETRLCPDDSSSDDNCSM